MRCKNLSRQKCQIHSAECVTLDSDTPQARKVDQLPERLQAAEQVFQLRFNKKNFLADALDNGTLRAIADVQIPSWFTRGGPGSRVRDWVGLIRVFVESLQESNNLKCVFNVKLDDILTHHTSPRVGEIATW